MAFLAKEGLKHHSIKSYLSGIWWSQIQQALGNPFAHPMPRLEYVLSGIKRVETRGGSQPRTRLPITIDILQQLRDVWLAHPMRTDGIMLWAAACVGFFSFLRAGEFTVPTAEAYDPETHLNLSDVALDSHSNPSMARLFIKQSKIDPFRQGVEIFLGRSGTIVCPVQALIQYIGVRPATPGPLFILSTGVPLTRTHWFPIFSQHSGRQVWTTQPTMGIVFELAPQPLQCSGGWKIRRSRPWANGAVMRINSIQSFHGHNWQAFHRHSRKALTSLHRALLYYWFITE